ncbi:hypothetical protein [Streptococcus parauberis]|uniref:hypothetical protein n=1 Tax=Streptococcus parauberis TaxID=1348 RepID=UPI0037BACD97
MSETRSEADKKLLHVANEFSESLISYNYEEAWQKHGELSSLLKNREEYTLPGYMIDMIQQHISSFRKLNDKVNQAHKAMSAIGHKLQEFK